MTKCYKQHHIYMFIRVINNKENNDLSSLSGFEEWRLYKISITSWLKT